MSVALISPASVVYNNALYEFFPCHTDDVCWTTSTTGNAWSPIQSVQDTMTNGHVHFHIAPNTTGSPVVYGDKIYLFLNGAGRDGTWFTTYDGSAWTVVYSLNWQIGYNNNFLDGTSPSATIFGTNIYVSWTDRNSKKIQYTTSQNGASWSAVKGIQ